MRKNIDLSDEAVKALSIQAIEKVSFDYDLNEKEETQLMKDYYL